MAATSQQWRQTILMVAAILAVISIGYASAFDKDNCPSGYKDCDHKDYNGCETWVDNDVKNCGDCGEKCKDKSGYLTTCFKGKCDYKDKCIDVKCPPYDYCKSKCYDGKCEYTCEPGYGNCNNKWEDGCEVYLDTDVKNCGYCGSKCEDKYGYLTTCMKGKCEYKPIDKCADVKCPDYYYAKSKCYDGKCEYTCESGYGNCNNKWEDGCEVYLDTDVKNCGYCDSKCEDKYGYLTTCMKGKCEYKPIDKCADVKCPDYYYAKSKCYDGKCEYTCEPGYGNCNNKWEDGCEVYLDTDVKNCGYCGSKCEDKYGYLTTCMKGKCEYKPIDKCEDVKCPDYYYAKSKCYDGKCEYTCEPGYGNCNDKWEDGCEVYLDTDVKNCGYCGSKCEDKNGYFTTCVKGKCEYKDKCEGVKCPEYYYAKSKCYDGKCEYTCEPGYGNCNDKWEDGCEVYLDTDVKNCGYCGAKCEDKSGYLTTCIKGKCEYKPIDKCEGVKCPEYYYAKSKCYDGKCEYTCELGYGNCNDKWEDGCEVYLDTDVKNCGYCGAKCEEKNGYLTTCDKGKCEYKPIDKCADVKCPPYNNAKSKCYDGNCEYTCEPGYDNCNNKWEDGCEVYINTDVKNCGKCGAECKDYYYAKCYDGKCEYPETCDNVKCKDYPKATGICSKGKCEYTCEHGYANCNDNWEDGCECQLDSDKDNCGKCGNKCPKPFWFLTTEATCSYGICGEQCKKGYTYDKSKKGICVSDKHD